MAKKDKGEASRIGEVELKNVVLGFEHVFKATAMEEGQRKKFSADFIYDPESKTGAKNHKAIKKAIKEVLMDTWDKPNVKFKEDRYAHVDGNTVVNDEDEVRPGYADMMVVKAKNHKRIPVFDRDGETPLTEEDDKIYRGAVVNAIVQFYPIKDKKKGGKGLFCSVEGIQFVEDGERIAGGSSSVKPGRFSSLEDEDEDEDDIDDEDDSPKKSKKKKSSRDDDDDDDDEDYRPSKKSKKSKKKPSRDEDEDEDDEDDEDEDDYRPSKKSKGKKKKSSRDDDEDDDEDDIDDEV